MLKGLENIEKETQETAALLSGDWIQNLKIKDGDIALVRFVTDKDELIRAKFHDMEKEISGNRKITIPVYCTMEDTGVCAGCSGGKVAYNTINLWAYVYYKLHKYQNPNIKAGSTEDIWPQVKHGKAIMYKEEVNTFQWFKTKYGYQGRYRQMFVDFVNEYETLCDRDYTWSRSGGSAKDTNYTLMAKKESPIGEEISLQIDALPDLGDVVSGKIRKFSSSEVVEEIPNTSNDDSSKEIEELF